MFINVINGPNLNLLGSREEEHYGVKSLLEIENDCTDLFADSKLSFFQSNSEGGIVDIIQKISQSEQSATGIVINLGAYTHTSIACLDALKQLKVSKPDTIIVEVHLSNVYNRDEFRKHSYVSLVADAVISGMRDKSYIYAISYIMETANAE